MHPPSKTEKMVPNIGRAEETSEIMQWFHSLFDPSHFFCSLWGIIALKLQSADETFPSTIDFLSLRTHCCQILAKTRWNLLPQSIVITFRVKSNLIILNHGMEVLIDVLTFLRISMNRMGKKVDGRRDNDNNKFGEKGRRISRHSKTFQTWMAVRLAMETFVECSKCENNKSK